LVGAVQDRVRHRHHQLRQRRAHPVKITGQGGGLTVGKSKIVDGKGKFSGAYSLDDLIGSYASVEAHAGADKSSNAQVMTKGDVSLALAGTGKGWDLGVGLGKFTIERR